METLAAKQYVILLTGRARKQASAFHTSKTQMALLIGVSLFISFDGRIISIRVPHHNVTVGNLVRIYILIKWGGID